MKFKERKITLKDGREYTIRPATPADSKQMIEYLKITAGETPFLLRYPDEIQFTLEREQELLQGKLDNPNEFMMLAEIDGIVAGNCAIFAVGPARRVAHRAKFAIAIKKDFWHVGLGTAFMEYALTLAKEIGYEQVELEVIDGNDRAKALYERMGFKEMGRITNAIKYDDGSYRDEISMVMEVK